MRYKREYKYKINEIFYSLQGEGVWTGHPMLFIRLSGCNLDCEFCDTEDKITAEQTPEEILRSLELQNKFCRRVVITGGEPTLQDLGPLLIELKLNGYRVHLETNGMRGVKELNLFDWIAVSPKRWRLDPAVLYYADEIKFLIGEPLLDWARLLWDVHNTYSTHARKFVMPIAKSWREGDRSSGDIIQRNLKTAIEFCRGNPNFGLCMQMHKVWGIP